MVIGGHWEETGSNWKGSGRGFMGTGMDWEKLGGDWEVTGWLLVGTRGYQEGTERALGWTREGALEGY